MNVQEISAATVESSHTLTALQKAIEKKVRDLDMIKQKKVQVLDDLQMTKSRSHSNQMRNTNSQ